MLFNYLPEFNNYDLGIEQPSLFTILNTVENITPSISQYREQLQHLQKLHFDNKLITSLNDTKYKYIALRYLLGVLHMNFKLLWDPTMNIIASYALGLTPNEFWSIFYQHIEYSITNFRSFKGEFGISSPTYNSFIKYETIQNLFSSLYKIDDKPDFLNYRILLWQNMTHFTDLCEAKNRNLSEIFINFVK